MKTYLSVFVILACLVGTLHAQVPNLISYQGKVAVGTTNFTGTGQFKFALVNGTGATTYWSNDGTSTAGSQPSSAVSLPVSSGLFSVHLGNISLTNMTAVPTSVFANPDVRVRVWFNDGSHGFQLLSPDSRLTPNGYLPDGITIGGSTTVGANILLPATSGSGSAGVIVQNGTPLIHSYGSQNIFAGAGSGNFTMTGGNNAAFGYQAFASNTSGNTNAAAGSFSLTHSTSGSENSACGVSSLYSNTAGSQNVAHGKFALYFNTTGNNNIAIGYKAGLNLTGDNNIDIGSVGVAGESGIIRIGDGAYHTDTYLSSTLHVANIVAPSDMRYKTDVQGIDSALDKVCRMRGVSYKMRRDKFPHMGFDADRHAGFIAQDLREVLPEVVKEDGQGFLSVAYTELIPVMVEAVKEQHETILTHETEIAALKKKLAALEARDRERDAREKARDEQFAKLEHFLHAASQAAVAP